MPRFRRDRQSRGKGLRTRNGCANCRARRVKCSECRPTCKACRRRQEDCVYPEGTAHRLSSLNTAGPPSPRIQSSITPPALGNLSPQADHVSDDSTHTIPQDAPAGSHLSPHVSPEVVVGPQETLTDPSPLDSAYSEETASLLWFDLLTDVSNYAVANSSAGIHPTDQESTRSTPRVRDSVVQELNETQIDLNAAERLLFRHFVCQLSHWIDVTDPDQSFEVHVSYMATQNKGLMSAVLALSARHASLGPGMLSGTTTSELTSPELSAMAVQFYNETLQYLQVAMQNLAFLRSDELLAAVLLISTYEMLDSSGRDWERHLKGVFWIQRSRQINGEMAGLKQRIWWAWLRQDIWAAYTHRRKILSFYRLTRPCSELNFWDLVNRSFFLLGQCVNYASREEQSQASKALQSRIDMGNELWLGLEEWSSYFAPHKKQLPTESFASQFAFESIWVHPPAASIALQAHHFARLLMLEHRPAFGGLRELVSRDNDVQQSVATICGLACCTANAAAAVISIQCLLAARPFVKSDGHNRAIETLIARHRILTGWPSDEAVAQSDSS